MEDHKYGIVLHDIHHGSRNPMSLSAPDINSAFDIAARSDAAMNLGKPIDQINRDCFQVTPASLNYGDWYYRSGSQGAGECLLEGEETLEDYCSRLDSEQANHAATLDAIGSGYAWSDVETCQTDWGQTFDQDFEFDL